MESFHSSVYQDIQTVTTSLPHSTCPAHDSPSAPPFASPGSVPTLTSPGPTVAKRPGITSAYDGVPAKRIKLSEEPEFYSENVRRKLAATSRTGQACDRCKERKMKCDTNPTACGPCQQKGVKCFTTDRVSGEARERGELERNANELQYLRDRLNRYERKYGDLDRSSDVNQYQGNPYESKSEVVSSRYIGWPLPYQASPLYSGPASESTVNLLNWGRIDTAEFDSEVMRDSHTGRDHFNFSNSSILRTTTGKQTVSDLDLNLPPKEEALANTKTFFMLMWQYVPILHKSDFLEVVEKLYDAHHTVSIWQKLQVVQVLAIVAYQTAVRNLHYWSKIEQAYRWTHYVLGYYSDLLAEPSLHAVQVLTLVLTLMRLLPKPGNTPVLSQQLLVKAIDMQYHRDPEKINLPTADRNNLSKQLRIRVFHSILGICVTTAARLGRPIPWQIKQWDVPLPAAVKDEEVLTYGFSQPLSNRCDYWPCIHLAKFLPLMVEVHDQILTTRKPMQEFLSIRAALKTKIEAWREDWDRCTVHEEKSVGHIIPTLLVDSWAAELTLNIFHPSVRPDGTQPASDLEVCHLSAKRLLSNFHHLSKNFKAADFSWHSLVAYALGFGVTLHIYYSKQGNISKKQNRDLGNELAGWEQLMSISDLVLKTNNYLRNQFKPLVSMIKTHCGSLTVEENRSRPPSNHRQHRKEISLIESKPGSTSNHHSDTQHYPSYDPIRPENLSYQQIHPVTQAYDPYSAQSLPLAGSMHHTYGFPSTSSLVQVLNQPLPAKSYVTSMPPQSIISYHTTGNEAHNQDIPPTGVSQPEILLREMGIYTDEVDTIMWPTFGMNTGMTVPGSAEQQVL